MNENQVKTIISFFEEESNKIDKVWNDVVDDIIASKKKLKLVIFGEAPLSCDKYFYKKPANYLNGLRKHLGVENDKLIERMKEEGILLFDMYKYPLPSEIYKKYHACFFDIAYVNSKLQEIQVLFDDETKFVFRYKMLIERGIQDEVCFKEFRSKFLLESQNPTTIFEKERPSQVIRDKIAVMF